MSDMMRRLTKEELYRFDGTPLFPERCAYTASYSLSPAHASLSTTQRYIQGSNDAKRRVMSLI
jgi:hypothetical protein